MYSLSSGFGAGFSNTTSEFMSSISELLEPPGSRGIDWTFGRPSEPLPTARRCPFLGGSDARVWMGVSGGGDAMGPE